MLDTSHVGCISETAGGGQVPFMKIGTSAHAVDQVISGVNPLHSCHKRRRPEDVTLRNLYLSPPGATLQAIWVSHKTPHPIACFQQSGHQASPHVAGSAGDQHQTGTWFSHRDPNLHHSYAHHTSHKRPKSALNPPGYEYRSDRKPALPG